MQGGNRRIFDKEADNHHEEPIFISQLAAAQLSTAQHLDATASSQVVAQKAQAAAADVAAVAAALAQPGDGSSGGDGSSTAWVGGQVNHPAVFPYLYGRLVLLWASAQQVQQHASAEVVCSIKQAVEGLVCALVGSKSTAGPITHLAMLLAHTWQVQLPQGSSEQQQQQQEFSPLFLAESKLGETLAAAAGSQ